MLKAFFLTLVLLSTHAFAANDTITCQTAFAELQAKLKDGVQTKSYSQDWDVLSPSVTFEGKVEGLRGGKRIVLQKIPGKDWASGHRTVGYDPQGDPRWPITVLGKDSADFFGFRSLTEEKMLVPDHQEFMRAIQEANMRLRAQGKEEIKIRFYLTKDNENVAVGKYVKEFQQGGGLPLGSSGNHYLHDISFHSGAMFLPDSLVSFTSRRLKYQEDFFTFLAKKYENDPKKQRLARDVYYALNFDETTGIDNATGLVTNNILRTLEDPLESNEMARAAMTHLRADLAPIDNIGVFLYSLRDDVRDVEGMFHRMNPERRKFLTENYSRTREMADVFAKDLKEFTETYGASAAFDPKKSLVTQSGFSDLDEYTERICKQMTEKRKAIIEATKK